MQQQQRRLTNQQAVIVAKLRAIKAEAQAQGTRFGAGAEEDPVNVPNAVTLAGYGLGLWWIGGGPAWAALASIVLDEVDGVVARERGETTQFGSTFDWASDVILTALTLRKLKAPGWTIPAATVGQVALREKGFRPPLGSLRAGLMLYGVVTDGHLSKSRRDRLMALGKKRS